MYEFRLVCKDGSLKLVELKSSLINWEGRPASLCITTDISEKRRTEKALIDIQQQLALAIEGSGVGLWDWRVQTGETIFNERWAQMIDYTLEELTPTDINTWRKLAHPDDLKKSDALLQKHFAGETPAYECEARMKHKDGHWTWVLDRGKVVEWSPDLKPLRMTGTHLDITDRKRSDDALAESYKKQTSILESISDAFFSLDDNMVVIYFNNAAETFLGRSKEEVLGHRLFEVFPEARGSVFEYNYSLALKEKIRVSFETYFEVPPYLNWYDVRVYPQAEGISVYFQVITERKQAEQEKQALQAQLFQAQKMEALGTLVGGIAHDFNNMLQTILGYSQLLLDDKTKGEPDYKDLQTIIETAQGGAELVKKLLAFGQQSQVIPVQLDLNKEINQVSQLISRTLPQVVRVELDLIDKPTTICSDHNQVDQVVMNLAINASEAMPNGGRLKIATTTVSLDEEYCRRHQGVAQGNYVMLSVADNGGGMDRQTLSKIFDPFFSTKQRGATRGTGLGLSVVKGIVQQLGGHITCESEPGEGTVFRVYFPVVEAPLVTSKVVGPTLQSDGTETILMVEDNIPVAEFERKVLANVGYSVIVANNGKDAIDIYLARNEEISLVILDLLMPVMSGRDCLKELLKINPSVRVLIASGYAPGDELRNEISPLVKGFLHKPFNMFQLVDEARSALNGE